MKKFSPIKIITALMFALVISGISFVSAFSSSATENSLAKTKTFYFVTSHKSQLEREAETLAQDVAKNNGAGFVWNYGNYYYAISSAYENKNDALLVCAKETQNDLKCEVVEIAFPLKTYPLPNNSQETKSTISNALSLFISTYKTLFDISISLDTKLFEDTTAKLEINKLLSSVKESKYSCKILFAKDEILSLYDAIDQVEISLNYLLDLNTNYSLLSRVRYCYCEILHIYYDFLQKID